MMLAAMEITPLVQLQRVTPANGAGVLVKREWRNPTGSLKDRMALGLILSWGSRWSDKAWGYGRQICRAPTGTSHAFVCGAKGYRMHAVSSEAFSQEKLDHMAALGAKPPLVPYDGRGVRREMFLDMIAAAKALASGPNTIWVNQMENTDTIPGYYALGEEIWRQTDGRIDAFRATCRNRGIAARRRDGSKAMKPEIKIMAWEPAESPLLVGGEHRAHDIEGIGLRYRPALGHEACRSLARRCDGRRESDGPTRRA